MSEDEIKAVQKLKLNNADNTSTKEKKAKETPAEKSDVSLFGDEVEHAFEDLSNTVSIHEKSKALHKAVQKGFQGTSSYTFDSGFDTSKAKSKIETSEYTQMLDNIIKNNTKLPKEELEKLFKEISGMDIATYKKQKKNGTLSFDVERLSVTAVNYASQKAKFGETSLIQKAETVTEQKKEKLDQTKETFDDVLASEGVISDAMNGIISLLGTSRSDVKKSFSTEEKNIAELKELASKKDIKAFMSKYEKLTGTQFKIENFEKLSQVQAEYGKAFFAKNLQDAAKQLRTDENWYNTKHNYNLESFKPAERPVMMSTAEYKRLQLSKPKKDYLESGIASPLEQALLKQYNGNKKMALAWIQQRTEDLNLKGLSQKEKYQTLVQDFIKSADTLSSVVFKDKDFETITQEYKTALSKAYGKNIPQEKIDNYIENQATAKGVLQTAVILGAGMMSGGSALAAALAAGGLTGLDKATDSNGLTNQEVGSVLAEMGITYASFKLFSAVANKVTPAVRNQLFENMGVDKQLAGQIGKLAGAASGGFATSGTHRLATGVAQGEDLSTVLKEAVKTGSYGAAMAMGFSLVGDALHEIKNKITEARYEKLSPQEKAAYDYDNLIKSLKRNQGIDEIDNLLQEIKGSEHSPQNINKVLEYFKKSLDGFYFAHKDVEIIDNGVKKQPTSDSKALIKGNGTEITGTYKHGAFEYAYPETDIIKLASDGTPSKHVESGPDMGRGIRLTPEQSDLLSAYYRLRYSAQAMLQAQMKSLDAPPIDVESHYVMSNEQRLPALTYNGMPQEAEVLAGFNKACPPIRLIPPKDALSIGADARAQIKARLAQHRPDIDFAELEKYTLEQLEKIEKLALATKNGKYTFNNNEIKLGATSNQETLDSLIKYSTAHGPKVSTEPPQGVIQPAGDTVEAPVPRAETPKPTVKVSPSETPRPTPSFVGQGQTRTRTKQRTMESEIPKEKPNVPVKVTPQKPTSKNPTGSQDNIPKSKPLDGMPKSDIPEAPDWKVAAFLPKIKPEEPVAEPKPVLERTEEKPVESKKVSDAVLKALEKLPKELSTLEQAYKTLLSGLVDTDKLSEAELQKAIETEHNKLCDRYGIPQKYRNTISVAGLITQKPKEEIINILNKNKHGLFIKIMSVLAQVKEPTLSFENLFAPDESVLGMTTEDFINKICKYIEKELHCEPNKFLKSKYFKEYLTEILEAGKSNAEGSHYALQNKLLIDLQSNSICDTLAHETYHEYVTYMLRRLPKDELSQALKTEIFARAKNLDSDYIAIASGQTMQAPEQLPVDLFDWLEDNIGNDIKRFTLLKHYVYNLFETERLRSERKDIIKNIIPEVDDIFDLIDSDENGLDSELCTILEFLDEKTFDKISDKDIANFKKYYDSFLSHCKSSKNLTKEEKSQIKDNMASLLYFIECEWNESEYFEFYDETLQKIAELEKTHEFFEVLDAIAESDMLVSARPRSADLTLYNKLFGMQVDEKLDKHGLAKYIYALESKYYAVMREYGQGIQDVPLSDTEKAKALNLAKRRIETLEANVLSDESYLDYFKSKEETSARQEGARAEIETLQTILKTLPENSDEAKNLQKFIKAKTALMNQEREILQLISERDKYISNSKEYNAYDKKMIKLYNSFVQQTKTLIADKIILKEQFKTLKPQISPEVTQKIQEIIDNLKKDNLINEEYIPVIQKLAKNPDAIKVLQKLATDKGRYIVANFVSGSEKCTPVQLEQYLKLYNLDCFYRENFAGQYGDELFALIPYLASFEPDKFNILYSALEKLNNNQLYILQCHTEKDSRNFFNNTELQKLFLDNKVSTSILEDAYMVSEESFIKILGILQNNPFKNCDIKCLDKTDNKQDFNFKLLTKDGKEQYFAFNSDFSQFALHEETSPVFKAIKIDKNAKTTISLCDLSTAKTAGIEEIPKTSNAFDFYTFISEKYSLSQDKFDVSNLQSVYEVLSAPEKFGELIFKTGNPMEVGNAQFNLPDGKNTIKQAGKTEFVQLDAAERPNPNAERITIKYPDGRIAINDWQLDTSTVIEPLENGIHIKRYVGKEVIDLSSDITPETITVKNNITGKSIEISMDDIISREKITVSDIILKADRMNGAYDVYTGSERKEKVIELFKKLSPTTILNIYNFIKAYPEAQLPYLKKETNSFCSGGEKDVPQIALSDSPHIVSHEALHGVTRINGYENDDALLTLHKKDADKIHGDLEDLSFYAKHTKNDGLLFKESLKSADRQRGLSELISILGTYDEYGLELKNRAVGTRLAFGDVGKAVEEKLMAHYQNLLYDWGLSDKKPEKTLDKVEQTSTPTGVSRLLPTIEQPVQQISQEQLAEQTKALEELMSPDKTPRLEKEDVETLAQIKDPNVFTRVLVLLSLHDTNGKPFVHPFDAEKYAQDPDTYQKLWKLSSYERPYSGYAISPEFGLELIANPKIYDKFIEIASDENNRYAADIAVEITNYMIMHPKKADFVCKLLDKTTKGDKKAFEPSQILEIVQIDDEEQQKRAIELAKYKTSWGAAMLKDGDLEYFSYPKERFDLTINLLNIKDSLGVSVIESRKLKQLIKSPELREKFFNYTNMKNDKGDSLMSKYVALKLIDIEDEATIQRAINLMKQKIAWSDDCLEYAKITDPEVLEKTLTLAKLKDEHGHKIFTSYNIEKIMSENKYDIALKLSSILDSYDILSVLDNSNILGRVLKLTEFKDSKGNIILGKYDLGTLSSSEELTNKAIKLLSIKDNDGIPQLPREVILRIAEADDNTMQRALNILSNRTGAEKIFLYNTYDFMEIVKSQELTDKLLSLLKENTDLMDRIPVLDQVQKVSAKLLICLKDDEKYKILQKQLKLSHRLSFITIVTLAAYGISPEDIKPLLDAKKPNGEYLFSAKHIDKIINNFIFKDTIDENIQSLLLITKGHEDKIDYICENQEQMRLCGYDNYETMMKYEFLNSNKDCIPEYVLIFIQTHPEIVAKIQQFNPRTNMTDMMQLLYDTIAKHLDLQLFNKLEQSKLTNSTKAIIATASAKDNTDAAKLLQIEEQLNADSTFPNKYMDNCLSQDIETTLAKIDYVKYYIKNNMPINFEHVKNATEDKLQSILNNTDFNIVYYLSKCTEAKRTEMDNNFKDIKQKCLSHPQLYINGTLATPDEYTEKINEFFDANANTIKILSDLIGSDAVDDILRYRFDDAREVFEGITTNFNFKDLNLLRHFAHSKKADGKSFISTERANMIDMVLAYKNSKLNLTKMRNMIKNNKVNLDELNLDLLRGLFKTSGLSEEEISKITPEQLSTWNLKFMPALASEIGKMPTKSFGDLFRAINSGDFNSYIHDTNTPYGISNAQTKKIFKEMGLNYDAWLHHDKSLDTTFKVKDKAHDKLDQIASQIIEDIETLRKLPAKAVIDKTFSKCIKEDKFIIPTNISGNKEKLANFVANLTTQLQKLWKRAEINAMNNNPEIAENAQNVLTIKSHLEQRIADIKGVTKESGEKTINWRIKMWDRIPQKDLFQGNFSTCCIGMGEINGHYMANYLMNTMFNMIEFIDEVTGKTVGNALCYYTKNEAGKPVFAIDNVEINNHSKPSPEICKKFRESLIEYIKNVNTAVANNPNMPIYLGDQYNDIPDDDLQKLPQKLTPLGDMEAESVYTDMFHGSLIKGKTQDAFALDIGSLTPPREIPKKPEELIKEMLTEWKEILAEQYGTIPETYQGFIRNLSKKPEIANLQLKYSLKNPDKSYLDGLSVIFMFNDTPESAEIKADWLTSQTNISINEKTTLMYSLSTNEEVLKMQIEFLENNFHKMQGADIITISLNTTPELAKLKFNFIEKYENNNIVLPYIHHAFQAMQGTEDIAELKNKIEIADLIFSKPNFKNLSETINLAISGASRDKKIFEAQKAFISKYSRYEIVKTYYEWLKKDPKIAEINFTIPEETLADLLGLSAQQSNIRPDYNYTSMLTYDPHLFEKLDYINSYPEKTIHLLKEECVNNHEFMARYFYDKLSEEQKELADINIYEQIKICMQHPELYVNGDTTSVKDMNREIADFFISNYHSARLLSLYIGNDALNDILRYRLDDASLLLSEIASTFEPSNYELLNKLVNSANTDGKHLISTEKVEALLLTAAYRHNNLSVDKITKMIKNNKIDVNELQFDLLKNLLNHSGLTQKEIESISDETLLKWDLKYIHNLSRELTREKNNGIPYTLDIFRASLMGKFKDLLTDTNTPYGEDNAKTQAEFKTAGLNYDAWLNPPKENAIQFKTLDHMQEQLKQISKQITEDIEALRNTKAKVLVDKIFGKFLKADKFVIPSDIEHNKEKLANFVKNLDTQLNLLWKRALTNSKNPDATISTPAKNTLTIKSHLQQRLEDIIKIQKPEKTKAINWTIKMWDRIPEKDLFQGNYSTCCIAMGDDNGEIMPIYMLNTTYNMIEIVNNENGKVVGNALIYYTYDKNGKPALIIDNIEVNNSSKPSTEGGIKLRKAIAQYAQSINKTVTGDENTPIYLGKNHNDIPDKDLPIYTSEMTPIGAISARKTYMDLFGGWTDAGVRKSVQYLDLASILK